MLYNQYDSNPIKTIAGIFFTVLALYSITISPVQKLISPLASSKFNVHAQVRDFDDRFSFAPGWAFNNINLVKFDGVQTIAYFDVPLLDDGTLYRDGNGYQLFREKIGELLERAGHYDTKIVLTVTQTHSDTTKSFLSSPRAQQQAIKEIVEQVEETGIDGVNIDFEYNDTDGQIYKKTFTSFVTDLANKLHTSVNGSQVSISLSGNALQNEFYDVGALADVTDKTFMMAYNFAVPEVKDDTVAAPKYGTTADDYWNNVSSALDPFVQHIPAEKLVLETAWYGDGENYPLYIPKNTGSAETKLPGVANSLKTPLKQDVIDRMVEDVPESARDAARKNLPLIAEALRQEGILNSNVLAYALATIEHETAGTFEPIEEIQGRKSARRLGYEGGTNYFGRGFIQLTHLRNYKNVGERIGLGDKLVNNPELALNPDISARILAAFFKDNGVATLASNGEFVSARAPVNPDWQGWSIANMAFKYLTAFDLS